MLLNCRIGVVKNVGLIPQSNRANRQQNPRFARRLPVFGTSTCLSFRLIAIRFNSDCFQVDLSRNKISFLSRKMFPSNPWIPYKLREVDLSYNSMPLITFDLVHGGSKFEKLNLSHNAIADIRRGSWELKVIRLSGQIETEFNARINEAFAIMRLLSFAIICSRKFPLESSDFQIENDVCG